MAQKTNAAGIPVNGMIGLAPRDAHDEYEEGMSTLIAMIFIAVTAVYLIVTIDPSFPTMSFHPPPPPPTLPQSWTARLSGLFRPPLGEGTIPPF